MKLLALLACLIAGVGAGYTSVPTFTAVCTGANEPPPNPVATGTPPAVNNGDDAYDVTATAIITLPTGQLCYNVVATGDFTNSTGIGQITLGHVHMAPVGVNGPLQTNFLTNLTPAYVEGDTLTYTGCVSQASNVTAAIIANPSGFYVNLHSQKFPGGAARGQLY